MPSNQGSDQSIGVTQFKSHCLELIDDVARGKRSRVVLMKHNRAVAAIVRVEGPRTELWGALKGTVKVAPGTELTRGAGETWKAEG